MRRRRHLHVDTFPFLAVLLCAMGSLILVLLIMDRKAKLAARHKAQQEAVELAEERRHQTEALLAERADAERHRHEDWEKKRDALHQGLAQKHEQVTGQVANVRKELDAAIARLQAEYARAAGVEREVQTERIRVGDARSSVEQVKTDAVRAAGEKGKANETLARMTTDLAKMEAAVRELKAARQAEGHTFSVVPYHGRQGSNRRPLYIECTGSGIVFHPDKMTMSVPLIGPTVRQEVLRRIAALPKPAPETPYLLLLVRPDGIDCYYELQSSLRGEQVEFGYECIDTDWVLDFPAQDDQALPQPWMATGPGTLGKPESPLPAPRPALAGLGGPLAVPGVRSGATGTSAGGTGSGGTGNPGSGSGGPGGIGWAGAGATGSGATSSGEPRLGVPAIGEPAPATPGSALTRPPLGAERGAAVGSWPVPGSPGGAVRGQDSGGTGGNGTGSASSPPGTAMPDQDGRMPGGGAALFTQQAASSPVPPSVGTVAPTGTGSTGSRAAVSAPDQDGRMPGGGSTLFTQQAASPVAPPGPGTAAPTGSGGAGTAAAIAPPQGAAADASRPPQVSDSGQLRVPRTGDAWAAEQGSAGGGGNGSPSFAGPQPPAPRGQREPPPRRPARLTGDRDWVVFIECRADGVVLYPSRETFSLSAIATPGAGNPLRQSVLQLVQRRQASVLPGQPPYRPQLRFLLRPVDLRTLHQVIPVLQPLGLPMTEQNLMPDDDVLAIVAGS
jgi:hypothetical protein